jgi:hypothetical protein
VSKFVRDVDRGWKRALRQAERFPRTFKAGVFDPDVAEYAPRVEERSQFMSEAFDGHLPRMSEQLDTLHQIVVCTGSDPAEAQGIIAEGLAAAIRASIVSKNLIVTGDLLDSIEAIEED